MILYDFRINKNVYRDISNEARRHHTSIHREIDTRLQRTLDPNYKYKDRQKLFEIATQTLEDDGYNEFMDFDYIIPKYGENTINELKKYLKDDTKLNDEICIRVAYTLHDPFYE